MVAVVVGFVGVVMVVIPAVVPVPVSVFGAAADVIGFVSPKPQVMVAGSLHSWI